MNLHTEEQIFQRAISAAAQHFNIPQIYIEKDYWVTVALYAIFHSKIADQAVFKGGTALSKCYKIIERFSEDIDIVVLKTKGETDNQLKSKIKAVTNAVAAVLPEVEITAITNKKGQIRKTAHQYQRMDLQGSFGQVREHIVLEATWLGNFEPYVQAEVSSYIADMMNATGQASMVTKYNLQPFPVKALSKERTLCEKVMSLVRFSWSNDPIKDLSSKIRHVFDIHFLLKDKQVASFFSSGDFDKLLLKVGEDDTISFKNNNDWIKHHPAKAIIFDNPADTWEKIKTPYNTTFKDLVTGYLPNETELLATLQKVSNRLKGVSWKL